MPAWCAPRGACAYSEGLGVWGGAGGGGRGPCSGGGATCGLSYAFIGLQGCELDASDCPRVEICPLVSGTLQKAHASSEVVRKGPASIITVTTVPALLSAAEWEGFSTISSKHSTSSLCQRPNRQRSKPLSAAHADAEFIYVPADRVLDEAKVLGAIPYDIPDVEFTHEGDRCSFDTFLRLYDIADPPLERLALIVRGADTSRHDLAPQCGGLFAISLGLSANFPDDHEMLDHGMVIYDALYTWCRSLQAETHDWPPR